MPRCQYILQNGNNCNKNGIHIYNNLWLCNKHLQLNSIEKDIYKYPPHFRLCDYELCTDFIDIIDNEYINFKIKMEDMDDLSLVMMNQAITPLNLSKFIYENLKYLDDNNIDNLIINKITYNQFDGLYYIYIY
jgi:hypothetical protein